MAATRLAGRHAVSEEAQGAPARLPDTSREPRRRIAFVFTGGIHQALHIAPVAAELSAWADVSAFTLTERQGAVIADLLARLGAEGIPVRAMHLDGVDRLGGGSRPLKMLRLLAWTPALRRFDALVTAERTTTMLRFLPGAAQPMIHIPHGAGDRAKGFERRIRRFDHVIVSGEKDRRRIIAEGLQSPGHCDVSGSIKLAAVRRLSGAQPPRFFANLRPTILYNPHFEERLSSWERFGRALFDRIVADGRFNLIVAPHVRLAEKLSARERRAWESWAAPDRILIDFGSERSIDMSYTRAADIYLGDVSSQIYEFIATPRPCVFLDAHATDWRDDPSYAMWRLGAVATGVDEAMTELARAAERHREFAALQRAVAVEALGSTDETAPLVAARQILAALDRLSVRPSAAPRRRPPPSRR